MRKRNDKGYLILFLAVFAAIIVVTAVVISNFGVISDFIVGMHYQPSSEMAQIRTDLELTGKGTSIFNASQPELMERVNFNQKCREVENEAAILGCYTEGQIYVYDVSLEELAGIRELATAHELLHAVYARMSQDERAKLTDSLAQVLEENKDLLGAEIESYSDEQRQEELYVRAGTEIRDLPADLEAHYAEIFANQDKIADFYESYIAVFRGIERKLKSLFAEIQSLQNEIGAKTSEYESGVASLNARIAEFNECAKTLNCFASVAVFNSQRAGLLNEQQNLKAAYTEISALVSKYNALVNEYNENVLHGQTLNMEINSSVNVEEVAD